jgi:hypothetical protein
MSSIRKQNKEHPSETKKKKNKQHTIQAEIDISILNCMLIVHNGLLLKWHEEPVHHISDGMNETNLILLYMAVRTYVND